MPDGVLATADGVRLYWRSIGDGPLVVIPNGLYFLDDLAPLATQRTLLAYDPRNRGRSDAVEDPSALGIERDVEDLEAVRTALGRERLTTLGHSYAGFLIGLHAARHPERVERLVMIGSTGPSPCKEQPPELRWEDGVGAEVFARLGELQRELRDADPVERCLRFWDVLARLYVSDPAHASRIRWSRCELANERGFLRYWNGVLWPSIQRLEVTPAETERVDAPALVVHGRHYRSAPWGGGVQWAELLPHATLLTIDDAAHAVWLERPEIVLPALELFLAGGA